MRRVSDLIAEISSASAEQTQGLSQVSAAVSLLLTIAYYRWGSWRRISLLATMEEAEEFVQSESDPAGRLLPNG